MRLAARLGLPFDRWFDARDSWALPAFLGAFVAVWTLCLLIAYHDIGHNYDVYEMFALGQHPQWGYAKHPPLPPWMMHAWAWVFPTTDWPAYLFAMLNTAAGLAITDRIARRWLSGDKRLAFLLLLVLVPAYHFLGATFNHNTVLVWLWPLATVCFLRSFETRSAAWGVAAGAVAGLAMLGKYYTALLLLAFIVAALTHPDRWRYLRSPAPWLTVVAGLVVLGPHLVWLTNAAVTPFDYVAATTAKDSRLIAFAQGLVYPLGALGYIALPIAVWLLAARTPVRDLAATVFARIDPARRMLLVMSLVMLLVPPVLAGILQSKMPPLWALPGLFIPLLFLVSAPGFALTRAKAIEVGWVTAGFAALALVGAPIHAIFDSQRQPAPRPRDYAQQVAAELDRHWAGAFAAPVPMVTAAADFDWALVYYLKDHPDFVPAFSLAGSPAGSFVPVALENAGGIAVCLPQDAACAAGVDDYVAKHPQARRAAVTVTHTVYGAFPRPVRLIALMLPPKPRAG